MNKEKMMKSRAAVAFEAGKPLQIVEIDVAPPKKGEVLIKIHKTAICGTDVHIYNWDAWSQKTIVPPMTAMMTYCR